MLILHKEFTVGSLEYRFNFHPYSQQYHRHVKHSEYFSVLLVLILNFLLNLCYLYEKQFLVVRVKWHRIQMAEHIPINQVRDQSNHPRRRCVEQDTPCSVQVDMGQLRQRLY